MWRNKNSHRARERLQLKESKELCKGDIVTLYKTSIKERWSGEWYPVGIKMYQLR